jgi:microcystin degradation protein MlrC
MYRDVPGDFGPTVVIDTGTLQIVVISVHQEPFDLNCLSSVGIDPLQQRAIVLKSRVHWGAWLSHFCTSGGAHLRGDAGSD